MNRDIALPVVERIPVWFSSDPVPPGHNERLPQRCDPSVTRRYGPPRGRPLLSGHADINARLNVIFNDPVLHLPGLKHTVQLRPNL